MYSVDAADIRRNVFLYRKIEIERNIMYVLGENHAEKKS